MTGLSIDPNVALFHLGVEDWPPRWFRGDMFRKATRLAEVTSLDFYLAQPQSQ